MIMEINTTTTSIYVTWSQKLDDFIKGFNITSTYTGTCEDYEEIDLIFNTNLDPLTTVSMTKFSITDLQENSNYSVTIVAYNDGGKNSSKVISVTTQPSGT